MVFSIVADEILLLLMLSGLPGRFYLLDKNAAYFDQKKHSASSGLGKARPEGKLALTPLILILTVT